MKIPPLVLTVLASLLIQVTLQIFASAQATLPNSLANDFKSPPKQNYPETWFHLIGGNVNREALTTDLEAVAASGVSGIQLFHGKGLAWPGVEPQIQTLSPT